MNWLGLNREKLEAFAKNFDRRDIENEHSVYMERYRIHGWVPKDGPDALRSINMYLHHFLRSDADDALHNHPWSGVSIILTGGYSEERLVGPAKEMQITRTKYGPGDVNVIGKDDYHRVDLLEADCWTLFVTGQKEQSWGFVDRVTGAFTPWRERLESRGIAPAY